MPQRVNIMNCWNLRFLYVWKQFVGRIFRTLQEFPNMYNSYYWEIIANYKLSELFTSCKLSVFSQIQ